MRPSSSCCQEYRDWSARGAARAWCRWRAARRRRSSVLAARGARRRRRLRPCRSSGQDGDVEAAAPGGDADADADAAVGWASRYASQPRAAPAGGAPFLLPVMPIGRPKLPTESVPLQIFEPRYRQLFKLAARSASRRFGVALAAGPGAIEQVGALCEVTHFIPVPERRRVFVMARAVGRFRVRGFVADKPFVVAEAVEEADAPPDGAAGEAAAAAAERRLWEAMLDTQRLAKRLFAHGGAGGDPGFGAEVLRYCPDPTLRNSVSTAPGADARLLADAARAGLLGSMPPDEAVAAADRGGAASHALLWSRVVGEALAREGAAEFLCSDAGRGELPEPRRRERFSFAAARALAAELGPAGLQAALYAGSTAERLAAVEAVVAEGRAYLAARASLRDLGLGG